MQITTCMDAGKSLLLNLCASFICAYVSESIYCMYIYVVHGSYGLVVGKDE